MRLLYRLITWPCLRQPDQSKNMAVTRCHVALYVYTLPTDLELVYSQWGNSPGINRRTDRSHLQCRAEVIKLVRYGWSRVNQSTCLSRSFDFWNVWYKLCTNNQGPRLWNFFRTQLRTMLNLDRYLLEIMFSVFIHIRKLTWGCNTIYNTYSCSARTIISLTSWA